MDSDMLKLKDRLDKQFTKTFGKRCKTKDYDDFPELKGDEESRCFSCRSWEIWDKGFIDFWKRMSPNRKLPIPNKTQEYKRYR